MRCAFVVTRKQVRQLATPWIVGLLATLTLSVFAAPRLEIMVEDDAAPWSQADGTGYANDVVKAAFRAVGTDVVLSVVPYARCKQMAISGKVAGCFSMSADPALDGKVIFSAKPLFSVASQYFFNAKRPLAARNEEELPSGAKIGTVIGYEYPEQFHHLRQRGVVFETTRSEESNLKKLAAGRLDAAIVNTDAVKTADFVIARAKVAGKVLPAFRSAYFGSYIGFAHEHSQGEWARSKFDAGYALIEYSGELQRIRDRWGVRGESLPSAIVSAPVSAQKQSGLAPTARPSLPSPAGDAP